MAGRVVPGLIHECAGGFESSLQVFGTDHHGHPGPDEIAEVDVPGVGHEGIRPGAPGKNSVRVVRHPVPTRRGHGAMDALGMHEDEPMDELTALGVAP